MIINFVIGTIEINISILKFPFLDSSTSPRISKDIGEFIRIIYINIGIAIIRMITFNIPAFAGWRGPPKKLKYIHWFF